MKKLLTATIVTTILTLIPTPAFADSYGSQYSAPCNSSYGGGTYGSSNCAVSTLSVNKTVQNPKTKQFVDNLGLSDAKYKPNQAVPFQVTVTNTGNTTLNNVVITDTFPQYTSFNSGSGTITNGGLSDTINVGSLNPNQSETFEIVGRVAAQSNLPSNQADICLVNQVSASADNTAQSTDNAQFCVETPVLGATTQVSLQPTTKVNNSPSTGPEALPLLGLFGSGILGSLLRRKTK